MRIIAVILGLLLCAAQAAEKGQYITLKEGQHPNDFDMPPLNGQLRSLIPWEKDPAELMDIKRWIVERDLRDLEPGWKIRERLTALPERVGKVISCIGRCLLYRGTVANSVRSLSRIHEGDEIHTGVDSYLWAMLTDGTLVRISPETIIGFLEVNISPEKVFFYARLGQGQVHWQPRTGREQKLTNAPETDPLFLPLMDRESNVQFFQRELYKGKSDQQQILFTTSDQSFGQAEQQKALNGLINANNEVMQKRTHHFLMVSPNASIEGQNVALSWYYGVTGPSMFRLVSRNEDEVGEPKHAPSAKYYFRGYSNDRTEDIALDTWMVTDPDGREMTAMNDVPSLLAITDIFPRRITTLMMVREKWLTEMRDMWALGDDRDQFAIKWGYRQWQKELDVRLNFLREYTRRMETTNLRSLQRLTESLKETTRSETASKPIEFDGRYFTRALDAYYMSVKRKHNFASESVRDMTPLQYYGWMLKNARQQ